MERCTVYSHGFPKSVIINLIEDQLRNEEADKVQNVYMYLWYFYHTGMLMYPFHYFMKFNSRLQYVLLAVLGCCISDPNLHAFCSDTCVVVYITFGLIPLTLTDYDLVTIFIACTIKCIRM